MGTIAPRWDGDGVVSSPPCQSLMASELFIGSLIAVLVQFCSCVTSHLSRLLGNVQYGKTGIYLAIDCIHCHFLAATIAAEETVEPALRWHIDRCSVLTCCQLGSIKVEARCDQLSAVVDRTKLTILVATDVIRPTILQYNTIFVYYKLSKRSSTRET